MTLIVVQLSPYIFIYSILKKLLYNYLTKIIQRSLNYRNDHLQLFRKIAYREFIVVFNYSVNEDFLQDKTMISEDYVSKEAMANAQWKGPLTKNHYKAIFSTFAIALVLSIATNQSIYTTAETEDQSSDSSVFSYSNDKTIDEETPLAQAFGLTPSKKEQLENYDDGLNDVDLADSDKQLDDEIAAKVSKNDSNATFGAKWVTENVQSGDNISTLFEDLNIPAATLMSILDNNKSVAKNVNSVRVGDKLSFLVDSKGELIVFIKPISDKEQLRFYKVNNTGKFAFIREKLNSYVMDDDASTAAKALASTPVKSDPVVSSKELDKKKVDSTVVAKAQDKTITSSNRGRLVLVTIAKGQTFSEAANTSGITNTEINRIIQMFKGKILFTRNIRAGDTMRVLFSDKNGKGRICAVEFNLARGGKIASYLNPADGKYYDERGLNATRSSFARFPIRTRVRVTSPFNPSRKHPVTGRVRPHNGVDFGLPVGSLVVAPADGIVDKASFSRSAGYYIVVRHSGGLSTVYMHLSKLSVRPGQRVKQGTTLARSGNTGLSTGPHLHYEIRVNGRAVNPLRVNLNGRNVEVNSRARKAFSASVARYKRELHQNNLMAKR